MKTKSLKIFTFLISIALTSGSEASHKHKPDSPLVDLPSNIRKVHDWGQRADFSHDGKRIIFLEKTYGDVFELDLGNSRLKPLTHHYYHGGYTRALYLANGDILLSGTTLFNAEDHRSSRVERAELWVLDKSLTKPPTRLGTFCSEGPAVSRKHMRIAWTTSYRQYPDEYQYKEFRVHTGDILYHEGVPNLVNRKVVTSTIENPFFEKPSAIETQNFIPPLENKITLSLYSYAGGSEVSILDLETGKIIKISTTPNHHSEPEGIYPDGKFTLVESSRQFGDAKLKHGPVQYIDLWKLSLDGKETWERITHFTDYPGYKSSNPVVSDDGRYIAFQMAKIGDLAGVGRGLFILDLQAELPIPNADKSEEGYVPLYNGKDLNNFYVVLRNGDAEEGAKVFSMGDETGVVHVYKHHPDGYQLDGDNGTHGMLYTKKKYSRYSLKFEYRWGSKKLNNFSKYQYDAGVYYHIYNDKIWPKGIEYQVRYNHLKNFNHTGDLILGNVDATWFSDGDKMFLAPEDGGQSTRSEKGMFLAKPDVEFHGLDGGWNRCEIIAMSDKYAIHKLNGKVVHYMTDMSVSKGIIGFQAETAELFYRNMRIRKFEEDLPIERFLKDD